MRKLATILLCLCIGLGADAQKITLLKDIAFQGNSSNPLFFPTFPNGHTLMMVNTGGSNRLLYETKGTAATTNIFYNKGSDFHNSVYADKKLYYVVEDNNGKELWISDGTSGNTHMIKNIHGSNDGVPTAGKNNMVYYKGHVYFAATDAGAGTELWRTDGTEAGTSRFANLNSNGSGDPSNFIIAGSFLFFIATNGIDGYELWRTDGTEANTKMVLDLSAGSGDGIDATTMGEFDGRVYFRGKQTNSTGWELYSSDGNTIAIEKNINLNSNGSSFPLYFHKIGNKLFFTATDGNNGRELWVKDLSNNTISLVKDINPGSSSSNPSFLGDIDGNLIFSAYHPNYGTEIWTSNGTDAGTKLIKDIYSGGGDGKKPLVSEYYSHIHLVNTNNKFNNVIYFAGDEGTNGIELWRTDGTDTGTYMVEDVGNKPTNATSSNLTYLMVDSNNVFLSMSNGENGNEPYIYKAPLPTPPKGIANVLQNITSLYPNPNNGTFKISLGEDYFRYGYLQVMDMTGRIIYDQSISSGKKNVTILLSDVASGLYKVNISLDRRLETHTLSITK